MNFKYIFFITLLFGLLILISIGIADEQLENSGCCIGIRGNIDGSQDNIIDIEDIVYYIDYAFSDPPGPPPPCPEEADVNGDAILDIEDIVYLIDYAFNLPSGPAPVSCPAEAPVVSGPSSSSSGEYTISTTYDWGSGLASTWDRIELQESTNPNSGFSMIAESPYGQHPTLWEVNVSRPEGGTFYYKARAYRGGGPIPGWSPYSNVHNTNVTIPEPDPPVLRIVNDLGEGEYDGFDWGLYNGIVRVRIGPTESAVLNDNNNEYERLAAWDYTCFISKINSIPTDFFGNDGDEDFDVSGDGPNYWVFVQCGWWAPAGIIGCWDKMMTQVLGCGGVNDCCYDKWSTFQVTNHSEGTLTVNLYGNLILPLYNWYLSEWCPKKSDGEIIGIDASKVIKQSKEK